MEQIYPLDTPMRQLISFNKLLEQYEEQLNSADPSLVQRAKYILDAQKPYPELRDGFEDLSVLEARKDIIELLLADVFSGFLTHNEIKSAAIPYMNIVLQPSLQYLYRYQLLQLNLHS